MNSIKRQTVLFLILVSAMIMSMTVFAEIEPNNTQSSAQGISFGSVVSGTLVDDDVDVYRIRLVKGNLYKFIFKENKNVDWNDEGTLIASICEDGESYGTSIYDSPCPASSLFQAEYTGNYYIKIWNGINDKYSFSIQSYNPRGKVAKDDNENTYRILSGSTVEFTRLASKTSRAYFPETVNFDSIGGISCIGFPQFTITSIGNYACANWKTLRSLSLGREVNHIGKGAFQGCTALGTEKYIMGLVIRGKNVKIEKNAFYGCKKLGTIRILNGASIASVGKNAFKKTKKKIRIEVPSVKKYKKKFKKAGFKKPRYSKSYLSVW